MSNVYLHLQLLGASRTMQKRVWAPSETRLHLGFMSLVTGRRNEFLELRKRRWTGSGKKESDQFVALLHLVSDHSRS